MRGRVAGRERRRWLAFAAGVARPCARHPPPSGMTPTFLTSTWTIDAGAAAVMTCGFMEPVRWALPVTSRSRSREIPAR